MGGCGGCVTVCSWRVGGCCSHLVCWHVFVAEGNNCCVCSLQHKPSLLWEGAPAAPDWDSSTPPPASPLPRVLAPDSDPEEEDESL